LLPKYRGASPIQSCILAGEKETGVSIMKTELGLDSGDILLVERTPIGEKETCGELSTRLSKIGAELIFKALNLYDNLLPYLIVGHTGMGMSFMIYRGSFKSMPNEFKEAASLDGAGHFTIMMIYFRLLMPLFVAYFMLGFIATWNNYMNCVIWLPSYPNLAYGIYVFREFGTIQGFTTPEMLAGFVIVAIPSVLLWTISQRFVGDRMVAGSLKG
jgi:ABC-type glycerol-3-phosphate transport system permease component